MSNDAQLDAYQRSATRTINAALSDDQRLLDAAAGLAEEAGEVLGHVRKHVMQGRTLDRDAVVKELGDALWCIAIAAHSPVSTPPSMKPWLSNAQCSPAKWRLPTRSPIAPRIVVHWSGVKHA